MHSRYIVIASTFLALATQAPAADSVQYYDAPATAYTSSAYDWTGFYIGAHGGYGWADNKYDHVETVGVGGPQANRERFRLDPSDWAGGFQAGYQHQIEQFVLGAEVAYTFFRPEDRARTNLNGFPRTRETEVDDLLTISAKGGFAWDRMLVYAKGGYSTSELRYTNRLIASGAVLGHSEDRVHGFNIGAGMDYALTDNWILGGEYSFSKFRVSDQQQMNNGVPVSAFNDRNSLSSHNLSLRLNYKF